MRIRRGSAGFQKRTRDHYPERQGNMALGLYFVDLDNPLTLFR